MKLASIWIIATILLFYASKMNKNKHHYRKLNDKNDEKIENTSDSNEETEDEKDDEKKDEKEKNTKKDEEDDEDDDDQNDRTDEEDEKGQKKSSSTPEKKVKEQKSKNFIEWLFFPKEESHDNSQCNPQFIHSYHLFIKNDREEREKNYICPYIKRDCCSFQSQKMIQVLWKRISEPRLQRVLTSRLYHIESVLNDMKNIIELFTKTKLPPHAKYSAECLESIQDLNQYVSQGVIEKFDIMYMMIKKGFNTLYKFKKQFYCSICNNDNVEYFDLGNKLIYFSNNFCGQLSNEFKDISWFLNYELKNYFTTIRNYILCYRDKNYLLANNVYEFKSDQDMIKNMAQCRDKQECSAYCEEYSLTGLPDMFIGQHEHLSAMKNFLDYNKPDNRGFFDKKEIMTEDEELQEAKDEEEADREDMRFKEAVKEATEGKEAEENAKHDFYKDGKPIEQVQWDFFKKSFDMHKQRLVRKKMASIRTKIESEYQPINLKENFLTVKNAKHNIINFMTKIKSRGLNPYHFLDREKIYKVNGHLKFFSVEVSNTVGELLNINETSALKKMVNVTKLMGENKVESDSMQQYIESKIFKNMTETKFSMIENPYIDVGSRVTISKAVFSIICGLIAFVF